MERFLKLFFLGFFILMAAHFVYWSDYWKPQLFYWDENYHIASAARYLKGVFFMEPHPPLGKLILALGEKLVAVNSHQTFGYEKFDIIPHQMLNPAFSFAGYRFFPSLFAIANVLLFAGIVYFLTESYVFAAALCSLPLFDTALILHSRGAMLDSFMLFGQLVALLAFFMLLKTPARARGRIIGLSFVMSFGIAFAFMTKLFGLALCMLWFLLYVIRADLRRLLNKVYFFNFLFVFIFSMSIWVIHLELTKRIEPTLMFNGEYMASAQYERWLLGLEKDSWTHIPRKLYENIEYIWLFERNVSKLNWEDPLITGSYPIEWPFGSRPIAYRWQREDNVHRYLYMIPNPWAWAFGLFGLLAGVGLWIRRGKRYLRLRPEIAAMLVLYFCYMFPMVLIHRVLYLYHYFPMLFISWIIFALVLKDIGTALGNAWSKRIEYVVALLPLALFQGFYNYRNFVYFSPTSCSELAQKDSIPFWGLKFPSCEDQQKIRFLRQFGPEGPIELPHNLTSRW